MKNRIFISFTLLFLFLQVHLYGQMAGNPVGAQGGDWTISVSTSTLNHGIGNYETKSQRHLVKSAWSLGSILDFYVLAGGVQLKMESSANTLEPYQGKFKLGIGTGFKMDLVDDVQSGFGLWVDGSAFRFTSNGSYEQLQIISGSSYNREHQLNYDWREFRANVGITIPVKRVKVYIAGSVLNIWRKDHKKEYLIDDESKQLVGESRDEYKSGVWTGGLAGLEIQLPDRYRLSVEVLGFNKTNYQILVGISQSGMSQW